MNEHKTRWVVRFGGLAVATALTSGIALIAGEPAHAYNLAYWMYDLNKDGVVDATAVDAVGAGGVPDGILDSNVGDANRDGVSDNWFVDRNQNGIPDIWAVDGDSDGVPSTWHVDPDEDGWDNAAFVDTDGDGFPDTLAGSGSGTMVLRPNPSGGFDLVIGSVVRPADPLDQCFVSGDPFDCARWPQVPSVQGPVAALPPGIFIATGLNHLDNAAAAIGIGS